LPKDLPVALNNNMLCREKMVDDLRDIIFAPTPPPPTPPPPPPSREHAVPLLVHKLVDKTHFDAMTAADRNVRIFSAIDNSKGIHLQTVAVECGGNTKLIEELPTHETVVLEACNSPGPWPQYGEEHNSSGISLPAGSGLIWEIQGPSELWISYNQD